jgi:hypothetical protein
VSVAMTQKRKLKSKVILVYNNNDGGDTENNGGYIKYASTVKTDTAVKSLTCIWDVFDWNLGWNTGCPESFRCLPQALQ